MKQISHGLRNMIGMLTTVKTTCARVILMALTGDGSMSTNCCTELRVWHTHTHTQIDIQASADHTPKEQQCKHTDRQTQGAISGKKV